MNIEELEAMLYVMGVRKGDCSDARMWYKGVYICNLALEDTLLRLGVPAEQIMFKITNRVNKAKLQVQE